jgi:hypothetical protein
MTFNDDNLQDFSLFQRKRGKNNMKIIKRRQNNDMVHNQMQSKVCHGSLSNTINEEFPCSRTKVEDILHLPTINDTFKMVMGERFILSGGSQEIANPMTIVQLKIIEIYNFCNITKTFVYNKWLRLKVAWTFTAFHSPHIVGTKL